jgi:2-polyprenyl-6-hydroxyphenyl methylase/3-demethylubiquinone-9 3-methyltransferase
MPVSAFADDAWWDPDGFLYGLHTLLEPLRGSYMVSALKSAGSVQGSRVLDIGSGGGFLAATLSDAGFDVIGIDPEVAAVREAAMHVGATFVLAVGEKLPFADGSFDSVVCSEVLEHVQDPAVVIAEASRVLRPGGVFVFSLPNRTLLSRLVLIDFAQRNSFSRVLPQDLHDWDRFIGSRDLSDLAGRHGLAIQQVQGVSIRVRDLPAAVRAMVHLRKKRISYAEAGTRVQLHLSRSRAVAYAGYALKTGLRDPLMKLDGVAARRDQASGTLDPV